MKNNNQSKPAEELYIQVWRNPIFHEGLLTILTPENWQTLTGLAMFIDKKGKCYPKLGRLGQILGLRSVSSVSNRITSLEGKHFRGNPILIVKRKKKQTVKGNWIFDNNHYYLNPEIVSIFNQHPKTLVYRKQQMREFLKIREKLVRSFSMDAKRKKNNITKDIY